MPATPSFMPHVMNTYGRLPIALERGQGVRVWDTQGHEYLDALSGIAVNTLGHAHPRLVAAISDQAGKMIHSCNYYQVPLQEDVAALLVKHSGLSNVFFCNSGLEANEACIKIARKYGVDKGVEKPAIIVFEHAFHGRSLATLAATGNEKVRSGFGPLPEGFIRIKFNDPEALQKAIQDNPSVVAIMIEVIQGEGGVHASNAAALQNIRKLCDQHDLLMMTDEIQCGFGRTGKWFAWQWADIKPDVMSLAKGLASGVPVGAIVCGAKAANVLQPGNHGSTFGGNPLAMRAARETILVMEQDHLLDNAYKMGEHIKSTLQTALQNVREVKEIRGQGLMIGIELSKPCGNLIERAAMEQRLLISVTAGNVIRLLPALTLTQTEADEIVRRLVLLIKRFLA
ncbi:MAG: aspartate aminotransferase family protein [Saezia sp.]